MTKQTPPIEPKATYPPSLEQNLREEYGGDLKQLALSEDQEIEFLLILRRAMSIIADFGIGLGPVPEKDRDNSSHSLSDLRVDMVSLLKQIDTAHETVAPRLTDNDEEQS